jgi:hypothetical protein
MQSTFAGGISECAEPQSANSDENNQDTNNLNQSNCKEVKVTVGLTKIRSCGTRVCEQTW